MKVKEKAAVVACQSAASRHGGVRRTRRGRASGGSSCRAAMAEASVVVREGTPSEAQKPGGGGGGGGGGAPLPVPAAALQACTSLPSLLDPRLLAAAIDHLKHSDAKLRPVIELHARPAFEKCGGAFLLLARGIVYQQLATKAANAIFDRLASLCGGKEGITPAVVSSLHAAKLRGIGISERKAAYLHDLAQKFISGGLSDSTIHLKNDEELMSELTAVKGIGVWSVHMFMIFALHRLDVLPVGDLGVRKGFQKLYNLKSLPTPAQMEEIALCWRPYRSLGSWYMWRLMEKKSEDSSVN